VSFAAITLCVASQQVFVVVAAAAAAYFVIDSVRKLLDTPSYTVESKQTFQICNDYHVSFRNTVAPEP
jgi:hypothetical protein